MQEIIIQEPEDPNHNGIPINVYFADDDHTIGHCECSNCHNNVDIFDHFCRYCGGKFTSRNTIAH